MPSERVPWQASHAMPLSRPIESFTIRSAVTSSPDCSETRRYRIREAVPASSWLKDTSRDLVAGVSFTGTVTSPKLMVPVHTAVGTARPPVGG